MDPNLLTMETGIQTPEPYVTYGRDINVDPVADGYPEGYAEVFLPVGKHLPCCAGGYCDQDNNRNPSCNGGHCSQHNTTNPT